MDISGLFLGPVPFNIKKTVTLEVSSARVAQWNSLLLLLLVCRELWGTHTEAIVDSSFFIRLHTLSVVTLSNTHTLSFAVFYYISHTHMHTFPLTASPAHTCSTQPAISILSPLEFLSTGQKHSSVTKFRNNTTKCHFGRKWQTTYFVVQFGGLDIPPHQTHDGGTFQRVVTVSETGVL